MKEAIWIGKSMFMNCEELNPSYLIAVRKIQGVFDSKRASNEP
jgi:hypothetical protein